MAEPFGYRRKGGCASHVAGYRPTVEFSVARSNLSGKMRFSDHMRNLIASICLVLTALSCDLSDGCSDLACYPGAPELSLVFEFDPLTIDSSYLDWDDWVLHDSDSQVRLYPASDTTINYSLTHMLYQQDSNRISIYGTGVSWDNLDDLEANLLLEYGNGASDRIDVYLGERTSGCCTSNYIDELLFNGVVIADSLSYYILSNWP